MRLPALLLAALLVAGCFSATRPTSNVPVTGEPIVPFSGRVGHVFLIVLENEGYETTFGASPGSPYLGHALPLQGRLLTQYYAVGHVSLDNYIAMTSGQPANPLTSSDCETVNFYTCVQAQQSMANGANIADQLEHAGLTWKEYADGTTTPCVHAAYDLADLGCFAQLVIRRA